MNKWRNKMNEENKFVDGLFIKAPHENAPDFVKCTISIKRADLGNWLRGKDDEWINLQVKESKGGKWYAEVDTWKPKPKSDGYQASQEIQKPDTSQFIDDDLDDAPF
jgi:hypothetical protein